LTTQLLDPTQPRALLIGVDFGDADFDSTLYEIGELAKTAGFCVVDRLVCKRRAPDPAFFVGTGKAEEIKNLIQLHQANEVLFDQRLSPAQQRNLERYLEVPVNDRTLLILEIFAQRARSHEGQLQVELAKLQYLSTRLVRRWSHLERQRGGVGHRGGPGETQIELDRRMLADSIKRTKERLNKIKKQRYTQRKQRNRNSVFNISLVGYTNAGKSSVFNSLVKAQTYAANKLFATLDTTTRRLYLEGIQTEVALSDTVGFIRDLPHHLVSAFSATLQEAVDADLLLHVVDFSNPEHIQQQKNVNQVLESIGAAHIPQLLVYNKIDKLPLRQQPAELHSWVEIDQLAVERCFISAVAGTGLECLRQRLTERVMGARQPVSYEHDDPSNWKLESRASSDD
jgi:GTP-binding protein HflX